MSLDAAPVSVRTPSSLELTRAASTALTAPLYRDGAAVTATAVTASLVDGSGTAVATGGTLTTPEDTPATGTLAATDVEGSALTFSLVAAPALGSVVITNAATGGFTYTPAPNASGSDTFTFRAFDGAAFSNTATVLFATAVAIVVPTLAGTPFASAFYRAMTLLVVASPCAVVISTPATILAALAHAAGRGLLFKGGAPLEELANGNVTPVVAKAPWYFLGLQELLAYFHPTVAGVLAPTVILVGAALVPFIDRGPKGDGGSPRPSDRKVGVMLFTLFMGAGLTITFLGAFFRGPGYAWTMPWDGFFFAL